MKKKTQKTKTFIIEEVARYEVKAKTALEAEAKFLGPKGLSCPFPTEVIDRDVWEDSLNKYDTGGRCQ